MIKQEFQRPIERLLLLTGRGLLGLYFIVPGISKITGFAQTSEYSAAHDVPLVPLLLVLTIAIQIGGGLALMFGFNKPVPRMTSTNPRKNACMEGMARTKCPVMMMMPPNQTAF